MLRFVGHAAGLEVGGLVDVAGVVLMILYR